MEERSKDPKAPGWGWGLAVVVVLGYFSYDAGQLGSEVMSLAWALVALAGLWACIGSDPLARRVQAWGAPRQRKRPPPDLDAARVLAQKLRNGEGLDTVPPVFRLQDGEIQHAAYAGVSLYEPPVAGDAQPTLRDKALRPVRATPAWREVCRGTLHVTSRRLVLDDGIELRSWGFDTIVAATSDDGLLELRFEQAPAVRLRPPQAHVLWVMVRFLAWGEIAALPSILLDWDENRDGRQP